MYATAGHSAVAEPDVGPPAGSEERPSPAGPAAASHFKLARCPCGNVLCDEMMQGAVRIKCSECKRRVWIMSDGQRTETALVDGAPKRMVS